MNIIDLPVEVLSQIVHQTEPELGPSPVQLAQLQGVDRTFHRICRQDRFWRSYCPAGAEVHVEPRPASPGKGATGSLHRSRGRYASFADYYHHASATTPIGPQDGRHAGAQIVDEPRKRPTLHAAYTLARIAHAKLGQSDAVDDRLFAATCSEAQNGDRNFLKNYRRPKIPQLERWTPLLSSNTVESLLLSSRGTEYATDAVGVLLGKLRWLVDPSSERRFYGAWSYLQDFELVRALLPLDASVVVGVPPQLRWQQRPLLELATTFEGLAYRFFAPFLRPNSSSEDIWLRRALATNPWALQHGTSAQRADAAVVDLAAAANVATLYFAAEGLRDDFAFMRRQIARDGSALEFASARLRANPTLANEAVTRFPHAAQFVSADLLHDAAWTLLAFAKNGKVLPYTGGRFAGSKAHALAAVNSAGHLLAQFNEVLRDDEEVVLCAVGNDGYALNAASPRLQAEPRVVAAAVQQRGSAFRFARPPASIRLDLIHQAVWLDPQVYGNLSPQQQREPGTLRLFAEALAHNAELYSACGHPLDDDEALTTRLFLTNPNIPAKIAEHHQVQPAILDAWVSSVLQQQGLNLRFFGDSVAGNPHYLRLALRQDGLALAFARLGTHDVPELVRLAVQQNGLALCYAGPVARRHEAVVVAAVAQNYMALEYIDADLRALPQFATARAAWQKGRLVLRQILRRDDGESRLLRKLHGATRTAFTQAWNDLFSALLEPQVVRLTALSATDIAAGEEFAFFGERNFVERPFCLFATTRPALGRGLPPPLLDLRTASHGQQPQASFFYPRELLLSEFCGAMQVLFHPSGDRRAY